MSYFKLVINGLIPEKIQTKLGWREKSFLKKIPLARFVTLPLSLKVYSWKLHKIVISIGISKTKNQGPSCHGNSIWFFCDYSCCAGWWPGNSISFSLIDPSGIRTFHILFIINLIPLEISCPQPVNHPSPPLLHWIFWNGIAKLIIYNRWPLGCSIMWVIFGLWQRLWKKMKLINNYLIHSWNSFRKCDINYALVKYSTYNI